LTPVLSSLATAVGLPAVVGEDFGLGGGLLEGARHADGDDAFLGVMEDGGLVLGGQRDDAVDDAEVLGGAEDERLVLLQHLGAVGENPVGRHLEGADAFAALHGEDRLVLDAAVRDLAVARVAFGRGVPDVGAVDVPVVEPR